MSDIVEVIAKAIDPDVFNAPPQHKPGECPVCDDNRETARQKGRVIVAALVEAGYHVETEFPDKQYFHDRNEFPGWHGAKDLQLSP